MIYWPMWVAVPGSLFAYFDGDGAPLLITGCLPATDDCIFKFQSFNIIFFITKIIFHF